ncbi:hypothetical protein ZEAMMB73_Zm00001d029634 [Zea mays]|uniref:Uncharacterized protein n=1 Tax=Zea mays TaxID=4577 RepID=A0A1D6K6E0_MAIZE|nr:hypothetical protein ZEAMMB73_Zm00001d029634 [Zea mays]
MQIASNYHIKQKSHPRHDALVLVLDKKRTDKEYSKRIGSWHKKLLRMKLRAIDTSKYTQPCPIKVSKYNLN